MSSYEPMHKSLFYKDGEGRTRMRETTETTLADYEPVDFSTSKSKEEPKSSSTALKVGLAVAAAIIGIPYL